jgi:hypothetical protein
MALQRKRFFVPGNINCLPKSVVLQSVLNEHDRRLGTIRGEGSDKG